MTQEFTIVRYKFSELSPEAQAKALEAAQHSLAEDCPTEYIEEIMLDTLSRTLYGVDSDGKVPDGIKLVAWDVSYSQGRHVRLGGSLNRTDAPALHDVWHTEIATVEFTGSDYYGQKYECYDANGYAEVELTATLEAAFYSLRESMLKSGADAYDDYQSEAAARENFENLDESYAYIFLPDGSINLPKNVKETV